MAASLRIGSRSRRPLWLLLLAALGLTATGCHGPSPKPGVVLVILDTVRADHLGAYGYSRATSPNLDRLAAEGDRFDEAWSQAPWTLPAIATVLTGLPPHLHGAGRGTLGLNPLRGDVQTLAERLAAAGFRTAAVANVVFFRPELGLGRGFQHFDYVANTSNADARDARATTDAALAWLPSVGEEPFFLLVHYFDAHLTYDPPPPYDTLFEPDGEGRIGRGFGDAKQVAELAKGTLQLSERQKQSLVARYDGEIRFVDEQFARLRAGLEAQGLWQRSLVIVVADHGEEFWDHGSFEHGHTHYRELLRVPLIVRRPGIAGGKVQTSRVRQLDIAPTVLQFAGLRAPSELPGRPLDGDGARYSVAEGTFWAGDLASVRSDAGTYIFDRTTREWKVFAGDDRLEHHDLWQGGGAPSGEWAELLEALPPTLVARAGEWTPSPSQREQLRSLGYVR